MKITIVYDNYVHREGLTAKWGFGAVVQVGGHTVLFDTGGDGPTLLRNMQALDFSPRDIELIVLSHEHGDHTGGLAAILGGSPDVTVCVPASFSAGIKRSITQAGAKLQEVSEAAELAPNVHSTGDVAGAIREQALVVKAREGLIVLTGCAHPGVVTLTRAAKEAVEGEVLFVGGGFHLGGARDDQVRSVIEDLRELGVRSAGASHCTGDGAIGLFREAFGADFVEMGVGRELVFDG